MNEKARIISVVSNEDPLSQEIKDILSEKLKISGFIVKSDIKEAELLICVGGDGTLIRAVHKHDFPGVPVIGINTGHLGFFQEIHPDQLDEFIFNYKEGRYKLQPIRAVQAKVMTDSSEYLYKGFNEIVIRGLYSKPVHLNISIGNSFIERFSGDGILIATPVGSTAYNYSIGGSIVDPRLNLLQVTPISPMNTTAYRSFTSSVLLPADMSLGVIPDQKNCLTTTIVNDGIEHKHENVKEIEVAFSDTIVNLLRFENYDFWNKVKTKFL